MCNYFKDLREHFVEPFNNDLDDIDDIGEDED